MINEEIKHGYHEGRRVQVVDPESEHHLKMGTIVYSGGKGTHHTVHDKYGNSFGFHPSANLVSLEPKKESIQEDSIPNIGSKVKAKRGQASGRIQTIATDSTGIKKAYVQTNDGRVIATPLDNIIVESSEIKKGAFHRWLGKSEDEQITDEDIQKGLGSNDSHVRKMAQFAKNVHTGMNESMLVRVKRIIAESYLLLEYNANKTWEHNGSAISERMAKEGHPVEKHEELFHAAVDKGDPTPNKQYGKWIATTYGSGGINRLEDIGTRVKPLLTKFHNAKTKGELKSNGIPEDIRKFKSDSDLDDAINKLPGHAVEEKEKPQKTSTATRHLVGENEHWQHFQLSGNGDNPATHDESRFLAHHYSGGTGGATDPKPPGFCRWCTAQNGDESKETYADHLGKGDLHILIPKKPEGKAGKAERYQVHHETNQQMDYDDKPVEMHEVLAKRPAPKSYDEVMDKHLERILGS